MNKTRKKIAAAVLLLLGVAGLMWVSSRSRPSTHLRVGVLVPVEHPALNEIAQAFRQTLQQALGDRVDIEIKNGQGNLQIQSEIIRHWIDDHVDLLVPVSVRTTQLTLSQAPPTQPVLFLSAEVPPSLQHRGFLAGITDKTDLSVQVAVAKKTLPAMQHLTVVHSINEKTFPEIKELQKIALAQGIQMHAVGIHALSDLSNAITSIPANTDALWVLKDVLVTQGIQVLIQYAREHHKPLIASDETSVQLGAAFAVGVREAQAGVQGARMAASLLDKREPSVRTFRVEEVGPLQVFFHPEACQLQGVSVETLTTVARQLQRKAEDVSVKKS